MNLRVPFLFCLMITGFASKAQSPVSYFFQSESAFSPSLYKHAVEEVMNVDPTAVLSRSDDMTVLQVSSTSGLIQSAYRSAIGQAGITLREGQVDPVALGLIPAPAADQAPVFLVTNDPAADLARYQAAVDQWNAAHPGEAMDRTPLHLNGK